MRSSFCRRLAWNGLTSASLLCLGTTMVEAQTPLEKLEQTVQTQLPVAAPTLAPAAKNEPGYLGILANDVTDPIRGVQLTEVFPGGPAQTAGLQPGDYITSIDGRNAATLQEMAAILGAYPADSQVTFVIRRGQQVQRLDVTLGKRPPPDERKFGNFGRVTDPNAPTVVATPAAPQTPPVDPRMIPPTPPNELPPPGPRGIPHPSDYSTPNLGPQPTPPNPSALSAVPANEPPPLLGVRAVPVTPEMQVSLNLPEPRGALVVDVRPYSPAHRAGLPLEAVIVAVDGKRIDSPAQLAEALQARGLGAATKISFFRYGQLSERVIKLGEGGPPPGIAAAPVADPLSETTPTELPGPVSVGAPTPPPAPIKSVPAPPNPGLPPSLIAPSTAVTTTPPIATPLPPKKPESENDALRRRVEELEAKLAEAEAKLKAQSSNGKEKKK